MNGEAVPPRKYVRNNLWMDGWENCRARELMFQNIPN
jgi:allantoicase